MTKPHRALCVELTAALNDWQCETGDDRYAALIARARAALAQPEPVAPTDDDVTELFYRHMGEGSQVGFENAIAEALARWGTPAIQPVPVSETWPEFSDCDQQEEVWVWNPVLDHWTLSRINRYVHTHWLPANALPTPEAND